MELKYDVPLTYNLFMRGVLYSLWKSRAFLLAIALLAAIYSALFSSADRCSDIGGCGRHHVAGERSKIPAALQDIRWRANPKIYLYL